jgi:hypothetical protein
MGGGGSSEHSNETSGSIKGVDFLEYLISLSKRTLYHGVSLLLLTNSGMQTVVLTTADISEQFLLADLALILDLYRPLSITTRSVIFHIVIAWNFLDI